MPLINEYYAASGRRLDLWEEQTSVSFTINLPPHPEAIPQPYREPMDQTPAFGALDDSTSALDRDTLLKKLNNGAVKVEFRNANGEIKTMLCTLCETAIPVHQRPNAALTSLNEVVLAPNPNTLYKIADPYLIKVYALDRQGWRSFRFERLLSFTPYTI